MKKLALVFALLVSTLTFAQEKEVTTKKTTIEETLQPYVKQLLEAAESGVKWGAEEIPVVIQQYVMFEAVYYGLVLLLGIGFLTFLKRAMLNLVLVKSKEEPSTNSQKSHVAYKKIRENRWLRYDKDSDDSSTAEEIFYIIFKYMSIIIGIIIVLVNVVTFVKVAFFPKLYLVEKFIELI